ncbi:hypothetical protein [Tranquillimonas rosea]|uniref:hypothetical protein n=1 Tax=Tranquillimonas rosea TaxID=641238 RepID=UPI003BAA640D
MVDFLGRAHVRGMGQWKRISEVLGGAGLGGLAAEDFDDLAQRCCWAGLQAPVGDAQNVHAVGRRECGRQITGQSQSAGAPFEADEVPTIHQRADEAVDTALGPEAERDLDLVKGRALPGAQPGGDEVERGALAFSETVPTHAAFSADCAGRQLNAERGHGTPASRHILSISSYHPDGKHPVAFAWRIE